MKKVALCIVYEKNNFGGLLQALATVSVVEHLGYSCEVLRYHKHFTWKEKIRMLPRLLNRVLIDDKMRHLKRRIAARRHPEFAKTLKLRYQRNEAFRQKYFDCPVRTVNSWAELCAAGRTYDAYLTGSDQLWSPSGLPTNFYNLMFTAEDKLRISYSSSFGVSRIPWYQKGRTRAYLNRIPFIAMRENSGAEIVRELTGRKVPVVADPAMLLTAEEWDELIPSGRVHQGPYIFAYLLGGSAEQRRAVRAFAAQVSLPVVHFCHLDEYVPEDQNCGELVLEDAGAEEFLNAVRFADYVITDSFHGTAFSVLYRRQFLVLDRYADSTAVSRNTRIDSLCHNLGLEGRRCKSDAISVAMERPIHYGMVETRLSELRKESYTYLQQALAGA